MFSHISRRVLTCLHHTLLCVIALGRSDIFTNRRGIGLKFNPGPLKERGEVHLLNYNNISLNHCSGQSSTTCPSLPIITPTHSFSVSLSKPLLSLSLSFLSALPLQHSQASWRQSAQLPGTAAERKREMVEGGVVCSMEGED